MLVVIRTVPINPNNLTIMKNIIILFFTIFTIASCSYTKEYKVITYELNDNQEVKESIDFIEVENDSLALIKAFEKFYISTEVHKMSVIGGWNDGYSPKSFNLFNGKNIDITSSAIVENKDSLILEMKKQILSLDEYKNFPKYSIINHLDNFPNKVSYDIRIERRCTKKEIGEIKEYLLELNSNVDYVFILFFLPGMKTGSGAWATANSDSDIMINEYMLDMNPTTLK